jgi:predicted deacylase
MKNFHTLFLLALLFIVQTSCKTSKKWAGQGPIRIVPTQTLPIQKQWKGVFDIGSGIYLSNDFAGGRLNGAILSGDSLISVLITSENTPINPSPWYAFKLWSTEARTIRMRISYQEGAFHRYHPKYSTDGVNWQAIAEDKYQLGEVETLSNGRTLAREAYMELELGPDTLWVAAQELNTSKQVWEWVDELAQKPYIESFTVGESRQGRPIPGMKIGDSDDKKMIFVLSRQHPPEVTGYLAMQAFVETLASDADIAESFRQEYNAYVIPLANPDGVDNGHWRHSSAGIDLNRDWQNVNQPEVAAIQAFLAEKTQNGTFHFGVDFHSTWEDIYYTGHPEQPGNRPGLVLAMIERMTTELGLDPNIRPREDLERGATSSSYMYHVLGAEALTYELGDNTPRDLLQKKGATSALKLMELLLEDD